MTKVDLKTYDRWRSFPSEMTAEQALEALKPLAEIGDIEVAHSQADEILCSLLRSLGHGDVVDAWEKVDKWYA